VTIIGGLIFSQMLTLFTTPVVYLYMDKLHQMGQRVKDKRAGKNRWRGGIPGISTGDAGIASQPTITSQPTE